MSDIDHTQPGAPLIHPNVADQALRDLMPVVEWMTNFEQAVHDGASETASYSLSKAIEAFRAVSPKSPALPAYINWLVQNTNAAEAEKEHKI